MKKITALLICLIMASSILVDAQIDKGKFFLLGSSDLSVWAGKEKNKYDGTTEEGYKFFDFNFMPKVAYNVIDGLPVGLYMNIDTYSTKEPNDGDKYSETCFSIGPFARYYFINHNNFMPYVEGMIGFGAAPYKMNGDKYKQSYLAYQLGAGVSYFFTDRIAADLFLGYLHETYTEKDEYEGGEDKYKCIYSQFAAYVGILVILGE